MRPPEGRCVVVGYDATEPSERALSWALRRASETGRVIIVHGARPQTGGGRLAGTREDRMARARATVELPFLERRDVYGDVRCDYETRDATPAQALLEVAEEAGADEIVLGAHRGAGLRSAGSVSAELLEHSERPVVVVP